MFFKVSSERKETLENHIDFLKDQLSAAEHQINSLKERLSATESQLEALQKKAIEAKDKTQEEYTTRLLDITRGLQQVSGSLGKIIESKESQFPFSPPFSYPVVEDTNEENAKGPYGPK